MRYKSCRLLEHGIYFYLDPGSKQLCVGHCCNTDNLELPDRLYLYSDLKNQTLSWDYIFAEKRKLRENAKKGIYPAQCGGCFELQERDWDDDDYINHLTAGHIMKCNSRCIYCPIGRIPECHNREQDVDMKPVIAELTEKNLLKYNGSLRFVGGEPTLMKEFDWLVDLFSRHNVPEIYVPTSAIRLSNSLCKAIEKVDSAAIVASVDSGTEETFEKIKGTKFNDIVWKNLKTYLDHARLKNFVIPKFILITNYNDTSKEIDKWLRKCADLGFVEVQFDSEHSVSSSEFCENKKYVNRTLNMLKYAEQCAKRYNIKVTSFLAFMNRAKRIYEKQLDEYKKEPEKYKKAEIRDEKINFDGYYSCFYIDLESISEKFINDKIEKLVSEGRTAAKRTVFINVKSSKQLEKNKDKLMLLLRLGFDFNIELASFSLNAIIDEIIKTSNSKIAVKPKFCDILSLINYFAAKIMYAHKEKSGAISILFTKKKM